MSHPGDAPSRRDRRAASWAWSVAAAWATTAEGRSPCLSRQAAAFQRIRASPARFQQRPGSGDAGFATVAREALRTLLDGTGDRDGDPGEAADQVVAGTGELDIHADVPSGVRALHTARYRMTAFTNGSAARSVAANHIGSTSTGRDAASSA